MTTKILFVTDGLANGGAERQLTLLVKYLPSEWECRVWSLGDGPFAALIRGYGVDVSVSARSWTWNVRPAFDLWGIIAAWKPCVVHSWGWMSSVAAGISCKMRGVRLIDGTIRMGVKPPRRQLLQRLGITFADRVVANSQAGLAAWGIASARGRVVYNGFDPERLSLCTAPEKGSPLFTVVMVGRMSPEKDYRTFCNAARILFAQNDLQWRFLAIGNGLDHLRLREENSDLIETGKLAILDGGAEVLPLISQAQVGVLLSPYGEGCSNAIMEYMACGLPVICNDLGGNRELVVDNETGFILPSLDPQALAQQILHLRSAPVQAHQMGVAGHQRLLRYFSANAMVKGMVQVYEEVLSCVA